MKQFLKLFSVIAFFVSGTSFYASAQQTDSIQLRIDNIQQKSRFMDKEGKAHLYSTEHYPSFLKYPVSEKKPTLNKSAISDNEFNQYRNELQHWYFLYVKKGYLEKFGPLPDLTGKKPIEGNTPIFDAATAPAEYRNKNNEQK